MHRIEPTWRPALAHRPPVHSAEIGVEALPEGHVIHVLAKADADPSAALARLTPDLHAVRPAGPGQWFIVGDTPLAGAALDALFDALSPYATCVDQSHGRVRICVAGVKAERLLARSTGADLGAAAFPVRHAATALFGHVAAHVCRTDPDRFELLVLRGFAVSLWDDLVRVGGDFGLGQDPTGA